MLDYNRLADAYARHRAINPEVLRALVAAAPHASATRILEVGCGSGNYIGAMRAETGVECWGVDPSSQMLMRAKGCQQGVLFRPGSATQLDFAGRAFDLIYSVDVIHHVADHAAHYHEAHRVLKPGGLICTVTDSAEDIRQRRPLSSHFPETVPVELARYPTIERLRACMQEAGFVDIATGHVAYRYWLTDLAPYRQRAFSCLHLIDDDAHERGLSSMEADLGSGPIEALSQYTLLWGTA